MFTKNLSAFCVLLIAIKDSACQKRTYLKNSLKWQPKIIGGVEASLESYPCAVQFFNKGAMCGGVILNTWTIITAAHCFAINTDTDKMIIQAGSRYLFDFNSKKYKVESFVVHENYSKVITFACDIALIFLDRPLNFSKLIKKAILVNHNEWANERETNFIVTGWGWTKYSGQVSNSLMMARLRYVPAEECTRLHNNYTLSSDMFCLYGDGQRDTCRGDSGGGVLWNNMLVGLTSHGDGCANKDSPSIYTNVWVFREWIKEHVKAFIKQYCSEHDKRKNENILREVVE